MKINFYIPKAEYIPTQLRLTITELENHPDIKAVYYPVPNEFAYQFTLYHTFNWQENTDETCRKIIEKITSLMCSQSYDHGTSWREVSTVYLADISDESSSNYKVSFRIRDAG